MARGGPRVAVALLLAACARPDVGTVAPPEVRAPEIRIGVMVGAGSVAVGGGAALTLTGSDGTVTAVPAGSSASVSPGPGGLRIRVAGAVISAGPSLALSAPEGTPVRVNGRDYRGRFLLDALPAGVNATNLLDLEDYLPGVVGAEMGLRTEPDLAALRAQAVLSRSIGLKAIGRWRQRGYDLLATVADQAYAGIGFESEVANRAVAETRGEVLTWQGQPIDGFFHSTCGGRTADGTEVFAGADRPYLRSIHDVDPAGRAWCAISPRFRWRESWSGEALVRMLGETLPSAGGSGELARTVQNLSVVDRTPTGRVAHLLITGSRGSLTVTGPIARLVLRSADGGILRSAAFNLQLSKSGGRITQLVAEGAGAGHGVGMCQWGALARSRAGFSYQDILSAYFPGTEITRTY